MFVLFTCGVHKYPPKEQVKSYKFHTSLEKFVELVENDS